MYSLCKSVQLFITFSNHIIFFFYYKEIHIEKKKSLLTKTWFERKCLSNIQYWWIEDYRKSINIECNLMPINGEKSVLTCREEQQFVSFCKRKLFSEKFIISKNQLSFKGQNIMKWSLCMILNWISSTE